MASMKVVNLTQGSDAWLGWRKGGITATDAVVLLGRSPHKTTWRLWAEKVGFAREADLSNNPLVRHGQRMEPRARKAAEDHLNDLLLPVCVESELNALMRASLDGITSQNEPVELKCPSDKVWQQVMDKGEGSLAYRMYYAQVQHQLLVTQAKRGWLMFWHEQEGLQAFEITPDMAMLKQLIKAAGTFWTQVEHRTEPEKDLDHDLFIPEGDEAVDWIKAAREYRRLESAKAELSRKLAELNEQQAPYLDAMKSSMGPYRHADYAGVMVTRYKAKGRVNYTRLLADKIGSVEEDELEQYRDAPSERTRVTVAESLSPRNIVDAEALAPLDEVPEEVASFHW
jgi:putative phage-type endonuclease